MLQCYDKEMDLWEIYDLDTQDLQIISNIIDLMKSNYPEIFLGNWFNVHKDLRKAITRDNI